MAALPRVLAALGALALGLGGALVVASPAAAATFNVTDPGDAGPGTLRQAIIDANTLAGPDTITFSLPAPRTITLTTVLPVISTDLTVVGPGETALTIDSPGTVLTVTGAAPRIAVNISGLTLTSAGAGACGISATVVTLTVSHVTASNLDCVGINVSDGSLTATDVTVRNDTAGGIGFTGNAATDNLTLTRVNADGAGFKGVNALLTGGTATLTDVQANNSGSFGVVLKAVSGATVTASDMRVDSTSAGYGITLLAETGSTISASALSATNNGESGLYIDAAGGSMVSISSSTFRGNTATDGGGVYVTAGDDGTSVSIADSTVSDNTSNDYGGGIYLDNIGNGATSTAKVVVLRTTVDGNTSAGYGAGIAVDNPAEETTGKPTVLIDSTTLSNNTTVAGGGGVYVSKYSGGPAFVKMVNSTLSSNLAQLGGGLHIEVGGGGAQLTTVVSSTTIADNSAHTSGGIETSGGGATSDLQIENSIIAGSVSDTGNASINDLQLSAPFTIAYSLVQKPDTGVVVPLATGNIVGVSPQLGVLANNGGSTMTRLLTPSSPAYNAANPSFSGAGLLDQRGQARVFERLDMGAVEWQPVLAHTGVELTPGPPLVAFLLLFTGLAMVAFSRLQGARSVG